MNLPNKLTIFRILLVPIIVVVYLLPEIGIKLPVYFNQFSLVNIIVLCLFILGSFTDYLDGTIARKNNLITTFGKFADPIADKLLINTLFILLAWSRTISPLIPIIMISRDIVVDAVRFLAANNQKVIAASNFGKLKTVMQMFAIVFILLNNYPFSLVGLPISNILLYLAVFSSLYSGVDYLMKNKDLIMESI